LCVFLNVWTVLINKSLKQKEILSVSYYSVPLHQQPVFENLGRKEGDFPVAEKVANQCLSLPMSPYLNQGELDFVVSEISNLCDQPG